RAILALCMFQIVLSVLLYFATPELFPNGAAHYPKVYLIYGLIFLLTTLAYASMLHRHHRILGKAILILSPIVGGIIGASSSQSLLGNDMHLNMAALPIVLTGLVAMTAGTSLLSSV